MPKPEANGKQPWFAPDLERAVLRGDTVTLSFSHVTFGLETFNRSPEEYFEVTDGRGSVRIADWQTEGQEIRLRLSAVPQGDVRVSYGFGSDPMQPPICDSSTYLPVLAFTAYARSADDCSA
jgi:hypothetical protein